MRLTRFDRLVLVTGGLVVLSGAVISSSSSTPDALTLLGHAMLFAVLVAAVLFGRRGGLSAAVVAAVVYVALLLPALSGGDAGTDAVLATAARLLSFGVVGIFGAELCTRMRYSLAQSEAPGSIDEWSRLYNQRYIHGELVRAAMKYERYGEAFSAVVLTVAPAAFSGLKPARQRLLVRGLADRIRSNVRAVDLVARLDDGRFIALLPHTEREGGHVVRDRLCTHVRTSLAASTSSVLATCLALPQDAEELSRLIRSIAPETDPHQPADWSGSYSSAASSTRNPADASTSSAPSPSTLNTSTAASPDGSTKQ